MVVNNLYIFRTFRSPHEANTPLLINANAVLPLAISFQGFKFIAWWYAQVFQNRGPIKLLQFSKCRALKINPTTYPFSLKEGLGILALETLDRHH